MKTCTNCGQTKPADQFRHRQCKQCYLAKQAARARARRKAGKVPKRRQVHFTDRDQCQVAAFKVEFQCEMERTRDPKTALALAIYHTNDKVFEEKLAAMPDLLDRWAELNGYKRGKTCVPAPLAG